MQRPHSCSNHHESTLHQTMSRSSCDFPHWHEWHRPSWTPNFAKWLQISYCFSQSLMPCRCSWSHNSGAKSSLDLLPDAYWKTWAIPGKTIQLEDLASSQPAFQLSGSHPGLCWLETCLLQSDIYSKLYLKGKITQLITDFFSYWILPPRQIKSTVRLCQRIKNRRRQIQTIWPK